MRVLVGCEFSGVVRDAFRARGHDAWSCDLLPASGPHLLGDVRRWLGDGWDLGIFFPPCTYVCSSGLHWNTRRPERAALTDAAVEFARELLTAPIPRIALENPIGCLSTRIRKPDQIVQPWMFGDDASKATCLWLVNTPPLQPTGVETMGTTTARYTDPLEAMDAGHRWCYAIPSNAVFHAERGFVPSLVVEDVAGHFPMLGNGVGASPWYWGMTREEAERTCEHANAKRGISADVAREIVSRSAIAPTRGNRRKVSA